MTEAEPNTTPETEDTLPEDMGQADAGLEAELKALQAKNAELEKKMAEIKDQALRALAEAENIRRRTERDRKDTQKFAVSSFAKDLLSVSDNLRRALNSIPAAAREQNAELQNIFTGVEATERELLRIFENNGIRKIDPLNEKFDPNHHEVLFESAAPDKVPGTVVIVVEPGYMIHERLLRPARVGVASGGSAASGGTIDQEI